MTGSDDESIIDVLKTTDENIEKTEIKSTTSVKSSNNWARTVLAETEHY